MKQQLSILPHQAEFILSKHRETALVGGFRSGKTFCMAVKTIMLACENDKYPGAVIEPTHAMHKKVFLPVFLPLLEQKSIQYTHNIKDGLIILHTVWGDRKIWLLSADKPTALVGLSLSYACIDEIDTLRTTHATDVYNAVASRLTGGSMQICSVSTPEGYKFLYDHFVAQIEADPSLTERRKVIKASTHMNQYIDDDYVADIRRRYPPKRAEAYLNGEFVNITSGQVYEYFDRNTHHTNKTINDFHNHTLHIGMDFNFQNMSATVSTIVDKVIYTIDEFHHLKDTQAMIAAIQAKYPDRNIIIYPDPAGRANQANSSVSSIAQLQQAGFTVKVPSKAPRIADRVMSVNAKLLNGLGTISAYVNTNTCPELTKCLELQGYDPDGLPVKDNKLDHMPDAYGYFIHWHFPIEKKATVRFIN